MMVQDKDVWHTTEEQPSKAKNKFKLSKKNAERDSIIAQTDVGWRCNI